MTDETDDSTMQETVAETYKKVFGALKAEGSDADHADEAVEPVKAEKESEPVEKTDERPRDESGKFAKKEPETEEKVEAKPVEEKPAEVKRAFVPKWQKQALEKWALLDPAIKSEVEKREQDFHKGIEQYKTDAEAGRAWNQAIAPYSGMLQAAGVPAQQAVQQLFATDQMLRNGSQQQKLAMFQKLAKDYGLDLSQMGQPTQQVEQAAKPAPEFQQLSQGLTRLQQEWDQFTNLQKQQKEQELNTQIQAFAARPERSEYFETLKPMMAALLQSGQADSLESAYDLAYRTHPVTMPLFQAKQREEWAKEARAKVETAKKASAVNVKQKGTISQGISGGTIQETVRAKARELGLTN